MVKYILNLDPLFFH